MSTQIQQQQVQGLVAAVSGISANAGNLVNTGATLAATLAAAEFRLDTDIATVSGDLLTTGAALSGAIVSNTNNLLTTGYLLTIDIEAVAANLVATGHVLSGNLVATGAALELVDATLSGNLIATGAALTGDLYATGSTLVASLVATGATLEAADAAFSSNLVATGATLSSNLLSTGVTLQNNLISTGDALSGNLVATGSTLVTNLAVTGDNLADRLGENSKVASNLGITTDSSTQLYGEVSAIPAATCSSRILQWVGDVPPGTTSGLYLGGVSYNSAQMPQNSQWFVKMYGTAKSIETYDTRYMGHTGICGLETGFVIDHESAGSSTFLSGIDGSSGVMGSGIHYAFQIGTSGTNPGYLVISGQNSYTGTVRFHATAYVSQMGT